MKTLAKIVGALVALVVVAVVAAVVLIPMFFDPNDHKDRVAVTVKEHTGRELKIAGDIRLTVFPWLGVEFGVVELGNAPGFADAIFARTEKVSVRIKLVPLLSRRVEMDTVIVHGLTLNLERKSNGATNMDDLGRAGEGKTSETPAQGDAADIGLAGIAIGGLDIRDANVSWKDGQLGQSYQIKELRIQTGSLSLGKPVDLELSFGVAGGKPAMSGRVELSGTIASDIETQIHELTGLNLKVRLAGEQFPNGTLNAGLSAAVTVDLGRHSANIRDFTATVGDLVLTGALGVTKFTTTPTYKGAFQVAEFNPKQLMKALKLPPIETADEKALTAMAMTFDVSGSSSRVALDPVSIKLDESALTGKVEITDFARSALRFELGLDAIDADRYLPPSAASPTATTPGAAAGGAAEIPVDTLRALNVSGTAKIGKLKISKLTISDIAATVQAKGGLIRLKPVSAKLYDGAYVGDITVDARGKVPSVALNEKLSGVQVGPLLTDLQGQDRLTGTASVVAALKAIGKDVDALKDTLGGRIRFDFTNGAVRGINIAGMLREAKAKLTGGSAAGSSGPNQTDFSELGGTILVKNGLATNDDLAAKSPYLRIDGKGQAHLVKETIDYVVTTSVVTSGKGQGGEDLKDLAGLDIPIRVTGTFSEPSYGLDFKGLASALAKSKAGALVGKQTGAITKKATEAVTSKIGGLGATLGGAAPNRVGIPLLTKLAGR